VNLPPWFRATVGRLLDWSPVATVRRVMDVYDEAGGALLAGGLTYSALFALLPSLLLLTGVLGLVVDDPERRRAILEEIGESLPPLRDFLDASMETITGGAVGFGALGLLGLAWGASRFYGSLDDAFARIFRDSRPRGFVERTIRGLLSVVLLVATFLLALAATGVASLLIERAGDRVSGVATLWQVLSPVLAAIVFVVATLLVYRLVPAPTPSWGAALPPAILVGAGMAVLTQLFSYIAPRLIGSAAVYGAFVALFAAMIWLSLGFQLLLAGSAWVRIRSGGAPTEPAG
jgi:membrane protein